MARERRQCFCIAIYKHLILSIQQTTSSKQGTNKKVNPKIVYREAESVEKEEAAMKQIETSSSSNMHLAVSGTVEVRLRANDTVGNEIGV